MTTRSSSAFFKDQVTLTLTTAFQVVDFGFNSIKVFIANDHATNYIEYSIDGTNVHGRLKGLEQRDMPDRLLSRIYLRGQVGGETFRVEIY